MRPSQSSNWLTLAYNRSHGQVRHCLFNNLPSGHLHLSGYGLDGMACEAENLDVQFFLVAHLPAQTLSALYEKEEATEA